jgi:hypothetical protein
LDQLAGNFTIATIGVKFPFRFLKTPEVVSKFSIEFKIKAGQGVQPEEYI